MSTQTEKPITIEELQEKYNIKYIDIKVIHQSSLMSMWLGHRHSFANGQILIGFEVTKQMVEDGILPNEGYFVKNFGILDKVFVTTKITDRDYAKQIARTEAEFLKKIDEKKQLDKGINRDGRNLNLFRDRRKKFRKESNWTRRKAN